MTCSRCSIPFIIPRKNKPDSLLQNLTNTDPVLTEMRRFDGKLNLIGISSNLSLSGSDQLLSYIVSLLRREQPSPPQATVEAWSEFLNGLRSHAIIPLLYWKIGHLPPKLRPPEPTVLHMQKEFMKTRARHLVMERQLCDVLDAFRREEISALVLRGPALARTVYPDSATRPFNDIDLLVIPEQYVKAREILTEMGYLCPFKRFETLQEFFNAESFSHVTDKTKCFEVDLHWSIFQYHGLKRDNGFGSLFDRKVSVETPTLAYQTLENVDALIHAAFHLLVHHGEGTRLIWIYDIALLAQELTVPKGWEVLQQRALQLKASLAVGDALKLAHSWFGLHIPEGYEDFTSGSRSEDAQRAELSYAKHKQGRDIRLGGYLSSLRTSKNKIRYLIKFLFPHPDYMRLTYPPSRNWLLPLSYVRRWGRWFAKFIQYVVHRPS